MRLLVVGTATVLVGCSLCADSEVRKFVSVRGDRAMVFVRDCGATTGYSTIVQIGRFPKADVVAVRGKEMLVPMWSPDGTVLTVQIPNTVAEKDVFIKAREAKGVRVVVNR